MSSYKIIFPAIGLALMAGAALAGADDAYRQYYEHRGPMPFEALDRNGDGLVTAEEHALARAERHAVRAARGYPMRHAVSASSFDQIDGDGDGSLSRDELSRWQAQRAPRRGFAYGGRWDN
jgi:Ca2+-binding EF-hand superfamily protein